jgi:hypothetical protein
MKRVYRTYHPRENEYFREVDDEYMMKLEELKSECVKQREATLRKRAGNRVCYERRKQLKKGR